MKNTSYKTLPYTCNIKLGRNRIIDRNFVQTERDIPGLTISRGALTQKTGRLGRRAVRLTIYIDIQYVLIPKLTAFTIFVFLLGNVCVL